jgi:hypothetical protein
MELKEYIQAEFTSLERMPTRVTDGLTQQELAWRPASGCNSIGLILFHTAKFEDSLIQGRIQGQPLIWQTEKWYEKLNLQENEMGAHYTVEQVNAFLVPESKNLTAYCSAVRARTLECLNGMNPEGFDRKVTMMRGESTIAGVFSFVIVHTVGHLGEISYLRGIQRGMDK